MSDAMDELVERLRVERETSPWWTQRVEHVEPTYEPEPMNGPLWDDSDVSTARRRRLLDEAAIAMEHRWEGSA